jgi:hypothetical protein
VRGAEWMGGDGEELEEMKCGAVLNGLRDMSRRVVVVVDSG